MGTPHSSSSTLVAPVLWVRLDAVVDSGTGVAVVMEGACNERLALECSCFTRVVQWLTLMTASDLRLASLADQIKLTKNSVDSVSNSIWIKVWE